MPTKRVVRRSALHVSLLVIVAWSVLPLLWTFQTSIKFTRDVASRVPVLWGYDTTAAAYRAYWFDDQSTNMWQVLLVLLVSITIIASLAIVARGARRPWIWQLSVVAAIVASLAYFSRNFDMSDQFEFLINSLVVTVATIIVSIGIGLFGGYGLARHSGSRVQSS